MYSAFGEETVVRNVCYKSDSMTNYHVFCLRTLVFCVIIDSIVFPEIDVCNH